MDKNEIQTELYCQTCGTPLLWQQAEKRVEVELEPDGTIRFVWLHAVCVQCGSKYAGGFPVLAAPAYWYETRADGARPTHKHADLRDWQRAAAKRRANS